MGSGRGIRSGRGRRGRGCRHGSHRPVKNALVTSGLFVSKAFWFGSLTAALIATAAWRGAFPRWYAVTATVAAPLLALGGTAVGSGGVLRIAGPANQVAFLAFAVWVLTTAVALWRRD